MPEFTRLQPKVRNIHPAALAVLALLLGLILFRALGDWSRTPVLQLKMKEYLYFDNLPEPVQKIYKGVQWDSHDQAMLLSTDPSEVLDIEVLDRDEKVQFPDGSFKLNIDRASWIWAGPLARPIVRHEQTLYYPETHPGSLRKLHYVRFECYPLEQRGR